VTTVNDYYQAFMLHQRAKEYGIKNPSNNLMSALHNAIGSDWIREFNAELFKWKLDKASQKGLSLSSIRLVELLANAAGDASFKHRAGAQDRVA